MHTKQLCEKWLDYKSGNFQNTAIQSSVVLYPDPIAWVNLDFGIEICFYNGMDTYSKTWLQFVFPVYIWVLVGLMILVIFGSYTILLYVGYSRWVI